MKKSLLQTVAGWLKHKPIEVAPETPTKVEVTQPVMPKAASVPAMAPAITPVATPAPRLRRTEPIPQPPQGPEVPLEQTLFQGGDQVKLVNRGAKPYAVCPHCEATWNIKERVVVCLKKVEKTLTCPSCSKPVALPATFNLRSL